MSKSEYIWFKKGREHRRTADPEGKLPTLAKPTPNTEIRYKYHDDGSVYSKTYYKDGKHHREGDSPAVVRFYKDGSVSYQSYFKDGKKHRDGDNPAVVAYNKDGILSFEIYQKNDKIHRDGDKPAWVWYHDDGSVKSEEYYKDGGEYTP